MSNFIPDNQTTHHSNVLTIILHKLDVKGHFLWMFNHISVLRLVSFWYPANSNVLTTSLAFFLLAWRFLAYFIAFNTHNTPTPSSNYTSTLRLPVFGCSFERFKLCLVSFHTLGRQLTDGEEITCDTMTLANTQHKLQNANITRLSSCGGLQWPLTPDRYSVISVTSSERPC